MTEERLVSLIICRLSDELSAEESAELDAWVKEATGNQLFLDRLMEKTALEKEINLWKSISPGDAYSKWMAVWKARRRARVIRITGWSVAASLLLAVTTNVLMRKNQQSVEPAVVAVQPNVPILPGRNTATLTLSDGRQILLDSVGKGSLAIQGNTRLVKRDSSHLSYEANGTTGPVAMSYNILTTPKAGQYRLTLPDGSQVWLNNVSSIRFPTAFLGKNRMVEISGEAYFEIVKNASQPFIVKVKDAEVEVLGTSFNIAAYPEEGGTQTTLLTGSVRVGAGDASTLLKPDEQAVMEANGGIKVLKNVPSSEIVSWKDGFFYFGRASFASVMSQLARWYDVEVVYEGKVPDMEFGGKIDRSVTLDEVLKFLDKNQIHFRLEGRKLIVLPS